jgi:signal transduction histidine kinase
MLDIAYKNTQRLNLLINDLLDMEKLLAGKMHFDFEMQLLAPLVRQAVLEIKPYSDRYGVNFVVSERMENLKVLVDGFRFQQVMSNFLSNAAKYSLAGGHVDVMLESIEGWARVSVRDYGSGIPHEFKNKVFHKFSQADSSDTRQKGGTGLGLAISKELIELMNGRIGFESEPHKGACFYAEFKLQCKS